MVKTCVSFILNYEEGAERSVLNGDAHSEPYLWEKGASGTYLDGARYYAAESEYEYGSRSGGWRILGLFKEMGWHFMSWAVAQAMEKNPSFARACVRDGHEIAAHGLRWLDISHMSVEEEKAYIKENYLSLEKTARVFPKGYFYGRRTPNTRALWPETLKEVGHKLLNRSESFDDVCAVLDGPSYRKPPPGRGKGGDAHHSLQLRLQRYFSHSPHSNPEREVTTDKSYRRQIPHVRRLHWRKLSRVPEINIRHAPPRRPIRNPQNNDDPDAFADYWEAGQE